MIADVRGYDKGNNRRPGNFMASLPFHTRRWRAVCF